MLLGAVISLLIASSFYLVCLPSKNKSLLGLYSNEKFIAITTLVIFTIVLLIIKSRRENYLQNNSTTKDNKNNDKYKIEDIKNILLIVIMSIIIYGISFIVDPTIRGDFAIQYFSNSQYLQNLSTDVHSSKIFMLQNNNLSHVENIHKWSSGIFYILNSIHFKFGLNMSDSLRLLGFIFSLFSSIYTYKITTLFTRSSTILKIASCITILMPFITGLSYINYSNCDIFSVSIITPCIYYTILILRHIDEKKKHSSKLFFYLVILTIILGSVVLFKKSTYIISASIFIFIIFYNVKSLKRINILGSLALTIIFFLPLLQHLKSSSQSLGIYTFESETEKKSKRLSFIQKEKIYYDELLGQYHSNSTNGFQIFITSLASPGWYAIGNSTFSSFADLFSMNEKIKSFLFSYRINQYIFFAFISAIPFSFLLLIWYFDERKIYPIESNLFLFSIVFSTLILVYLSISNQCFNFIINRDFRYKLPLGLLLQCYLLFKIDKLKHLLLKSFLFYLSISYFFTFPLLKFCIYYTNHYANAGRPSLNGFFTHRDISTINRETNQYICLKNNEFTSSEILNIIITDDKADGFAYFLASELKGNIAFCKSDDFPFLKDKPDNFKCVHFFIHKNILNQSNITKSVLSIPKNLSSYTPIYSYLHIT
ncbi:hypothetical protein N9H45_09645 [Opitutales bacterium]|nr:hypothetical protein [Opitutales bacterium]